MAIFVSDGHSQMGQTGMAEMTWVELKFNFNCTTGIKIELKLFQFAAKIQEFN